MTSALTCLWCRNALLRHVRRSGVYWFCNSCRQEIHPLLVDLGHPQRVKSPLEEMPELIEAKISLTTSQAVSLDAEPPELLKH